jgi:hypothetical protein
MQAAMEAEGAASRRQPRRSPSIRDPLEDQVLAGQVVESQTLDLQLPTIRQSPEGRGLH